MPGALPVEFGIFDWIDDDGQAPGALLAQHLDLVALADELGCVAYHLAEHHGTPLGAVPSPNVFLAAATVRTSRIRLGAMVNVLPLYDPVRLAEEVCLLDHLSGGRLDLGVGRGGAPAELAVYGLSPDDARTRYEDVFETLLATITGEDRAGDKGPIHRAAAISQRPRQVPYPPLWYPTSNASTVPWLGSQGLNTLFSSFLLEHAGADPASLVRSYAQHWQAARDRPGRLNAHVAAPTVGVIRHVVVADDDASARALARPALDRFFDTFNKKWIEAGLGPYVDYDYDRFEEQGHVLVGSASRVRELLGARMAVEGNYMAGVFSFGGLPHQACMQSLRLFASEVVPGIPVVPLADRASQPGP